MSKDLFSALTMTWPTASHHLKTLEAAGLLSDRRKGRWIFYYFANPIALMVGAGAFVLATLSLSAIGLGAGVLQALRK